MNRLVEKIICILLWGLMVLFGSCEKSANNRAELVDNDIKQHLAVKTANIPPRAKSEIAASTHIDDLSNISIESQKWMHDTLADVDNPQLVDRLIALHHISDGGTMHYFMMECLRKFLRNEKIDSTEIMKGIANHKQDKPSSPE